MTGPSRGAHCELQLILHRRALSGPSQREPHTRSPRRVPRAVFSGSRKHTRGAQTSTAFLGRRATIPMTTTISTNRHESITNHLQKRACTASRCRSVVWGLSNGSPPVELKGEQAKRRPAEPVYVFSRTRVRRRVSCARTKDEARESHGLTPVSSGFRVPLAFSGPSTKRRGPPLLIRGACRD